MHYTKKQLICVAFDNCGLIDSWKAIRQFSLDLKSKGHVLPYTFFISAVKLIADRNRSIYDGPDGRPYRWSDRPKPGQSNIGFGGSVDEIKQRVEQINLATAEGHEIASHAVGHFFAEKLRWNSSEWSTEFWYFEEFLKHVGRNHGFGSEVSLDIDPKQIKGFRAPYLQEASGLNKTLTNYGFGYDTSDIITDSSIWPTRFSNTSIWNFGLPLIDHPLGITPTNPTGKTIPMDWNWFYFDVENQTIPKGQPNSGQLKPETDPMKREQQKQGMLDGYVSYFESCYYNPDRPPMHIGHHFKMYNHGIYWQALQEFIAQTIDKPDVEFVTYTELMQRCVSREKALPTPEPIAESAKKELIEIAADTGGAVACGPECC